jgi:uncharacterized protein YdcH (DUF465 family)
MNESEIKEYLREHDEEYRRLEQKHRQYKQQLEELADKVFLTPEQQKEKKDIKKLKLKAKDQLQQIIINYRKQSGK